MKACQVCSQPNADFFHPADDKKMVCSHCWYELSIKDDMRERVLRQLQDPESTPLTGQVGGSHYKQMKIQPAVYTTANGIGHMAGDAIAYISRYKFKNGRQDLEKAIHSIQLLIELEYGSGDDPREGR